MRGGLSRLTSPAACHSAHCRRHCGASIIGRMANSRLAPSLEIERQKSQRRNAGAISLERSARARAPDRDAGAHGRAIRPARRAGRTVAPGDDIVTRDAVTRENIDRQKDLTARAGQRQRPHQPDHRIGDAGVTGRIGAAKVASPRQNQRAQSKSIEQVSPQ